MEERVEFYEEQLKKLREDLRTQETFMDTPRYTNFMGIETNLNNIINQLKSMIQSKEEARLRELENEVEAAE